MLDHLFQLIAPYLLQLFPSTRLAPVLSSFQSQFTLPADIVDQPVWQFLAALALHASTEQQQTLVATLREKVYDIVLGKSYAADDQEREARLANVNLFLHALGLFWDGTQFIYKSCQLIVLPS
jgi:DNA topoisomerase 2-associated protein PAT1